jgi:hypothetical protein
VSREQRTRLNILISEQTGAAQPAPGRTTRTEQLEDEQEAAAPLEQGTRRRSVFDAPHVADLEREPAPESVEPTADDDTTPR